MADFGYNNNALRNPKFSNHSLMVMVADSGMIALTDEPLLFRKNPKRKNKSLNVNLE